MSVFAQLKKTPGLNYNKPPPQAFRMYSTCDKICSIKKAKTFTAIVYVKLVRLKFEQIFNS